MQSASAEVRATSLRVAATQRSASILAARAAIHELERPNRAEDVQTLLFELLGWWQHDASREFLLETIRNPGNSVNRKTLAARALSYDIHPALAGQTIPLLANANPAVGALLHVHLERLTNHTTASECTPRVCRTEDLEEEWRRIQNELGELPLQEQILLGFQASGIPVSVLDWTAVDVLIQAGLRHDQPHIRFHANRALGTITGRWAPRVPGKKTVVYWQRWWSKNRSRFLSME